MKNRKETPNEVHWELKSLGQIATIKTGKHDANHQDSKGNYPFFTCAVGQFRSSTYAFDGPSIILPGNGANVGKTFFYDGKFEAYQRTYVVNELVPNVNPIFLLYCFKAHWADYIESRQFGSATNYIVLGDLKAFPIPLPPLPEQQRIVGILDEAFEGIAAAKANAEKNLQNARALFDSHLHSIFTQRGDGWVEKPLGTMCERITKGSSPKWQGIAYVDKPGVLFVTSENVGEYELLMDHPKYVEAQFNAKDKKSILKIGDVLTNIVGASIGRTAVFDLEAVSNINQAVCLIRCNPSLLNRYFLTYLLNSPVFKQVLHDNEIDNARANLSLGFFSKLPLPVPPLPKQQEIVGRLDSLRTETQRLESIYQQKLAALEALKKSLLHRAFTGQLTMDN
ncbi:MAG: restriction endonuclease subunit S [Nitrospirales bacterium]|nr:restriction endonuclease subunit S [Nitrospirales bacterium]